MSVLELDSALQATAAGAQAKLSEDYQLNIDVLEHWLCRVAICPSKSDYVAQSWMIGPPDSHIPWQGRNRLDNDGFSCPPFKLNERDNQLRSDGFDISVQGAPLAITISRTRKGTTQALLVDRPMAAYRVLPQRSVVQHAQTRDLADRHFGLGDKAGALDRTGSRFRCLQTDRRRAIAVFSTTLSLS